MRKNEDLNGRVQRHEPSTAVAKLGQTFTQTIWLENSGTRPWTGNFTLLYLGAYEAHHLRPAQESYPVPPTAPGQTSQLTVRTLSFPGL